MNPSVVDQPDIFIESRNETTTDSLWNVILYNDEHHPIDAVIFQVQKATGVSMEAAFEITITAHTKGRAVCFTGTRKECERVANILKEINLIVGIEQAG